MTEIEVAINIDRERHSISTIDSGNMIESKEDKVKDEFLFFDMKKESQEDLSKKKQLHQRRLGNMYAFFYKAGEPLFVIGPHCINL
jgi:hypothetical protein